MAKVMMMKMIMMTTAMVLMRLKAIHQTLAASGRLFHLFFRGRCTIAHVRSSRQCQDDDDEENNKKNEENYENLLCAVIMTMLR